MIIEDLGTSNGLCNGEIGEGSSVGMCNGEVLRTYKRRKPNRPTSETKLMEDERVFVDSTTQLALQVVDGLQDKELRVTSYEKSVAIKDSNGISNSSDCPYEHWRNVALEQMCESLNDHDGGIWGGVRDALVFGPRTTCTTIIKEDVHTKQDKDKGPPQASWLLGEPDDQSDGPGVVLSNGTLDEQKRQGSTEMCQHAFFNIITSGKFASLCKILFENFPGIKVDSFFDFNFIHSRMKEGAYEHSPQLFSSDIQQVWKKLQRVGTEMVSLAKSLSDMSRSSYFVPVGGSTCGTYGEEKIEPGTKYTLNFVIEKQLDTRESNRHAKAEQASLYEVCTCLRCGDKADGTNCLVCDSCEEMYHVSCLEPAVEEIPLKSWYCSNCVARGIELPHENCVVCERLNASKNMTNGVVEDAILADDETHGELEENSEDGKPSGPCKICKNEIDGEAFRVCGHPFCPNKAYHVSCLTSKQLKSYGPRWYCPSCLCRACLTDKDDNRIVLCDGCDHAYHIYCMNPPRDSIPRGKWFCTRCNEGIQKIRRAKKALEKREKKWQKKAEEEKKEREKFEMQQQSNGRKILEKAGGGVDMLLTAAKTLNYEEILAADHLVSGREQSQ
ncbi:Zinc finger, PHD-finger [Dillenia turbinata]|uniref:Zinc finger, PHD-finger n=1 Tax=Dillenia turbinata TaxID=194707 RepID=A0AAN8VYC0_9MAGN